MKYSIVTFGCRVNQADSLEVEKQLLASGGQLSPADGADVVAINTLLCYSGIGSGCALDDSAGCTAEPCCMDRGHGALRDARTEPARASARRDRGDFE